MDSTQKKSIHSLDYTEFVFICFTVTMYIYICWCLW